MHSDLDALYDALLPLAQQTLGKGDELTPFGATMRTDGHIDISGHTGRESHEPADIRRIMAEDFRKMLARAKLRAVGLCVDAWVAPPDVEEATDAIQLSLQHQSGEALDVFVTYRRRFSVGAKGGSLVGPLEYGLPFTVPGTLSVFPAPREAS
jgi:hypothetical protein